jgi:pyruvate kinase
MPRPIKLNRHAKIVATIGPASSSRANLEELIKAGVNVIRLNLSHATLEEHAQAISDVRAISKSLDTPVAVLLDLQGPKIRTGKIVGGPLTVTDGQVLKIVNEGTEAEGTYITTTYTSLNSDVTDGDRILIDDGLIELHVDAVENEVVTCTVIEGGVIKDHKGMNLPGVAVSAPSLTEKDIEGLGLAVEHNVDYIALSFVRTASDVTGLRELLQSKGSEIPIIAKIEKGEAIDSLEEILVVADGLMVARGDLGVELSPEKVPLLQKQIIAAAHCAGKVVITATQMLESMINHARPTRAEASDVANAVLDGTDALMLSGETAVGKHPIKAVEMMSRIIAETENSCGEMKPVGESKSTEKESFAHMVASAARAASNVAECKAIVVFTQSGHTAGIISKLRPNVPIIALTPVERTCSALTLLWGVQPFHLQFGDHTDEMICRGEAALIESGIADWGDTVIIVSGTKVGMRGATNMMKIDWIGSEECRIYLATRED